MQDVGQGREAVRRPEEAWIGLILLVVTVLAGLSCGVKKTVTVQVPQRILKAKTAGFEELVGLVDGYSTRIRSLASTTMRVTYRSGKIESGKVQQYRSAPGYLLLRLPDSLRLDVQNPLTKTTVVDLASVGDAFSLWIPSENKFFEGKNSIREITAEGDSSVPSFGARPIQILEAILPPKLPLGVPGYRIAMEEAEETTAKYYVLSVYRELGTDRLAPVRKLWIERSDMAITRQLSYDDKGDQAGIVSYADFSSAEGLPMPLSFHIERPLDGYSLDLSFKSWRVNPQLPDDAFILTPPPGARRIRLVEKE